MCAAWAGGAGVISMGNAGGGTEREFKCHEADCGGERGSDVVDVEWESR